MFEGPWASLKLDICLRSEQITPMPEAQSFSRRGCPPSKPSVQFWGPSDLALTIGPQPWRPSKVHRTSGLGPSDPLQERELAALGGPAQTEVSRRQHMRSGAVQADGFSFRACFGVSQTTLESAHATRTLVQKMRDSQIVERIPGGICPWNSKSFPT